MPIRRRGFSLQGGPPLGAVWPECCPSTVAHWRQLLLRVSATAVFCIGAAAGASSTALQWDNNGVLPVNGGTGAWNTTSAFWFNGAAFQTWSNAALDDAVFGATAGTVTLAAPITAHNLSFDTTGYVVTGNTLTLGSASPAVSVVAGGTATIGSTVAGTAGLNKTGDGTLTLSGAGTYTGATTVSSGTLVGGATNAFVASSAYTVASDAILSVNFNQAIGSLAGAGTVTNGGTATRTLTTGGNNSSTTFSGVIQNGAPALALTKSGTGTLTLAPSLPGTNTYTGGTLVNVGTLAGGALNAFSAGSAHTLAAGTMLDLGGFNQAIASLAGTSGTVTNAGSAAATLATGGAASTTFAGVIQDGTAMTSLTKTGAGTFILSGENTFTGLTTIAAGTLQVGSTTGTTGSIASDIANSGALIFNRSIALTYGGDISGTGTVTKSGSGTLTLTGINTYSGATTLSTSGSRLQGGALNAFSAASAHTLATGTILDLGGFDQAIGSLAGTGGTVTNAGPSAAILATGGAAATTFAGVIQDGAGTTGLTKTSAGTFTLTGANTFTGGTTITSGTLQVGNGATGSIAGDILNNSALIFNRTGVIPIYGGDISGTGTVTKSGASTLTLTGENTYTGATTVSGTNSILQGGVVNAFSAASAHTVGAGAFLDLGGFDQVIGSLAGAGRVTNAGVAAATLATGGNDASSVFSGVTQDGTAQTALTKTGTGTLTLSGTNTYTGVTTISSGTLQLGNASSAGSVVGDIVNNGALVFNRTNAQIYAGAISGSGSLTKLGASTLTLAGENTFTGNATITAGSLQVGDTTGTTGSIASNIVNNSALIFNRSIALTYGGDISGSGTVTKSGAGTLTLMGDNTYTGNTTISTAGSRLQGGAENAFSAASAHTLGAGTFLDLGGFDQSIGSLAGTGRVTNAGVTAATMTTGSNNANTSYSGIIQNEVSVTSLTKVGTGTLTLSGANTYTGATTISGGTLLSGATSAFGQNSAVTVAAGATLGISSSSVSIGSLAGAGTVTNGGATTRTLTVGGDNTSTAFSGVIQNGAGLGLTALTKAGTGTLTLSGANTYTGATLLNVGTLQGGALNAFSAGSAHTVAAGAILDLGGFNQTIGSLAGTGGTVTNAGVAAALLTTGGTAATTFAGVIQDGTAQTALTKTGSGTLTLTGANTFAGGTTISGGTMQVGSGAIGSIAGNILNDSALIFSRTAALPYGGVISGTGTVTKSGSGTLTLTGENTYLGGTTISAGTLQLGSGGTAGSITGNIVDNGILAVNRSDALTLAGTISGTGALTKSGVGTLTLTGNNTYTGTTTIGAGTLQVGDGGTTGSVAGSIVDNGTLAFNRSNALTYGGVISGTGSLVKSGAGTLTLSSNNTYVGGTTINAGTLQLGSGGTTGSVVGSIVNDGELIFNRSNVQTFAGAISGTGSLTKISGNTLTLTGNNTFTGGTTISAGTLQVGTGTIGSIAGDILDNSALVFNRSNALTYGDIISGTGSVTKLGAGTLTLTGENTYTGGTTITAGTLQIGDGGTSGSIAGAMINNGAFIFDRSDALTYAGAISGTGSLIKNGAGTLTLTGVNPYTGGTIVNDGVLLLNNAVVPAPLVASPSGFVGGTGSVGTATINGTLSPGNSIGVITVLGDLTFVPGSTFLVEVSPTAADRTDVTGIANLSGLVEVIGEPGTYVPNTLYTIVAAAGVNGVFDGLSSNFASSAFITPSLSFLEQLVERGEPLKMPQWTWSGGASASGRPSIPRARWCLLGPQAASS